MLGLQVGDVPGGVAPCAAVVRLCRHERAFGTARSVRADWRAGQRCDGDCMGRGTGRDWCWRLLAAAGCRVWACCDGVGERVKCGVGVRVAGGQSRIQARSHSNSQVVVVVW
jgi:hypothetical protein